ncbi:MAG: hypothetical protein DUD35_13960 [Lactobacillus sp.]|nr:MAG: hypothetical protein DUD35_13960 [Lactobacillus sp.]
MSALSAHELADLSKAVSERIDDALLPAISKANRTGDLTELLRLLGMGDLLDGDSLYIRPTKIVVLGATRVNVDKLRSCTKKKGFDLEDFEFVLNYKLEHYNFSKLRNTTLYRAVLAGPMPHSTPGKGCSSSTITEMENNPEIYPPVIELRDSTGLKITMNSFERGLEELKHMC